MLHTQRSPACETLRHHARTCPKLPTASRSYRDRVDLRSAPRSRAPAHQPSAIGFASGMRRPRRSAEARRPHAVSRGPGAVNTPLRQGHKSGRDGPIEAPHWALPSSHPHVRTKARARCVVARLTAGAPHPGVPGYGDDRKRTVMYQMAPRVAGVPGTSGFGRCWRVLRSDQFRALLRGALKRAATPSADRALTDKRPGPARVQLERRPVPAMETSCDGPRAHGSSATRGQVRRRCSTDPAPRTKWTHGATRAPHPTPIPDHDVPWSARTRLNGPCPPNLTSRDPPEPDIPLGCVST
jgi:hypothetical protein